MTYFRAWFRWMLRRPRLEEYLLRGYQGDFIGHGEYDTSAYKTALAIWRSNKPKVVAKW